MTIERELVENIMYIVYFLNIKNKILMIWRRSDDCKKYSVKKCHGYYMEMAIWLIINDIEQTYDS